MLHSSTRLDLTLMVDTMKATAESSRLRILLLLSRGDLTVSDLTEILNQSQPRVSRHLRLLLDAGLIERYQEGSWAWFRLSDQNAAREFVLSLTSRLDPHDPQLERDSERLASVKARRREAALEYFNANAQSWDEIRSLHASDSDVEAALMAAIGTAPVHSMLDLGTGTGRMLVLFAPLYQRGVGIDQSREMLAVARANLDNAGATHAQVRLGDVYALPIERDSFDLVTLHQVLHHLDEPALAIQGAARALRPGGRLVIVDFAPHQLEFLREEHAHVRLGFSDQQIQEWMTEHGLETETTREVTSRSHDGGSLVVRIWIGRDPRLLVATEALAGESA